ncbi:MAG: hypothetical protein WDM87_09885 [Terracidiphilus sp.]
MDEYADHLEHLVERTAISSMEGQSGQSGNQNGAQGPVMPANQGLVSRLRQSRATGRIVLNLAPSSDTVSSLPEMVLEDGDRLVIPSRPSTIQVIGAVFNQNAFLFEKDAHSGRYLRLAGGQPAKRTAIRFFVLRADGSVVHRGKWGFNLRCFGIGQCSPRIPATPS